MKALDEVFRRALATGDERSLEVLGYGELSVVVRWDGHAVKRLPLFPDDGAVDAYASLFHEYIAHLQGSGIRVVPSHLERVQQPDGRLALYVVQPIVPQLLPTAFSLERLRALADHVLASVSATYGLDAQLSNWGVDDQGLVYLDVTTPLCRDTDGHERLDADLFVAALPWALRGLIKRSLISRIADTYFQPGTVLRDVLGNLVKEGLGPQLAAACGVITEVLGEPVYEAEVRSAYRWDARLWQTLLVLRRADRFWQRQVRRRPYPHVLPGPIAR